MSQVNTGVHIEKVKERHLPPSYQNSSDIWSGEQSFISEMRLQTHEYANLPRDKICSAYKPVRIVLHYMCRLFVIVTVNKYYRDIVFALSRKFKWILYVDLGIHHKRVKSHSPAIGHMQIYKYFYVKQFAFAGVSTIVLNEYQLVNSTVHTVQ